MMQEGRKKLKLTTTPLHSLALQLYEDDQRAERWLVLGAPQSQRYCPRADWRGDGSQVSYTFAAQVLKQYLDLKFQNHALLVHLLDCSVPLIAPAIRHVWRGRYVSWCAVGANDQEPYEETWKEPLEELQWTDFDAILAINTLSHAAYQDEDAPVRIMTRLRGALSSSGILIISEPTGVSTNIANIHQFSKQELDALFANMHILYYAWYYWTGSYFERVPAELIEPITGSVIYGWTNNAGGAAALGCYVLCR